MLIRGLQSQHFAICLLRGRSGEKKSRGGVFSSTESWGFYHHQGCKGWSLSPPISPMATLIKLQMSPQAFGSFAGPSPPAQSIRQGVVLWSQGGNRSGCYYSNRKMDNRSQEGCWRGPLKMAEELKVEGWIKTLDPLMCSSACFFCTLDLEVAEKQWKYFLSISPRKVGRKFT